MNENQTTPTEQTAAVEGEAAALAKHIERNPGTTATQALGATAADPDTWMAPVRDAIESDDPHAVLTGAETEPATVTDSPNGTHIEVPPEPTPEHPTTPSQGSERVDTTSHHPEPLSEVAFTNPQSDVYPPELLERVQWMGRKGKLAFAPWGDRNADLDCRHRTCIEHAPDDTPRNVLESCPDCQMHRDGCTTAECRHDARYKWKSEINHLDGERVAMGEDDPRLDGRAFIQQEDDPYAFVDGDDVRCPTTGEVHPAFKAILAHLGRTYTDVSESGSGVHAYYRGTIPLDGKGQATFDIDTEPWGENEDPPTVEIYANTHICVTTGEHVPGTPLDVTEWDTDVLRAILEAREFTDDPNEERVDREEIDFEGYEPTASGTDETTTDVRDILYAVDQLQPEDLAGALHTQKVGADSTGWEKWDPSTYRSSSGNDSLHRPAGEAIFHDHKEGESFGVLGLFAAEQGIIDKPWQRLAGDDFWTAVDAARDAGAPIPTYEAPSDSDREPVAAFAPETLERLAGPAVEQVVRESGPDIPSTQDARERLRDAIFRELRAGGTENNTTVVLDAPTALGKSYAVATTPWLDYPDVTGDAPAIHLHATRDARDDAFQASRDASRVEKPRILKGRTERCNVAAGDHDPTPDDDTDPDVVVTIDGEPASDWFDTMCDEKGLPFSTAHAHANQYNDQSLESLPCCGDGGECPAVTQWDGVPRDDNGETAVDIVHATHQFANVPSIRRHTNVIFDEQPDFKASLTDTGRPDEETGRVRRMVTAYLAEIDAPVSTWESFITLARYSPDDYTGNDAANEQRAMGDTLTGGEDGPPTPGREWYVKNPDAHALAPAITTAIWRALRYGEADANGRRSAKVFHEPPRFDAEETYAGGWLTVVIDEQNTVQTIRDVPDLNQARTVVGLDAHPCVPLWALNTGRGLNNTTTDSVLEGGARRLWRRFERGLTVIQIGDATRPRSGHNAIEWTNKDRVRAVLERLRDYHGSEFTTAITTIQVKPAVKRLLRDACGEDDIDLMHYGKEKSRNDFANERVGYVYGCMDGGDAPVLNALCELDLDAEPTRVDPDDTTDGEAAEHAECSGNGCHECNHTGLKRAKGREFDGPDADAAHDLLASIRENHVAQAAGRYARNADDPENHAVVYLHTDAAPEGFIDYQIPDVQWLATDTQAEIVNALAERGSATAKEIAEAVDCTKEHVRKTLSRLEDDTDAVSRDPGAGAYGADEWHADAATTAVFDVANGGSPTVPYYTTNRWSLAISSSGGEAPQADDPVERERTWMEAD